MASGSIIEIRYDSTNITPYVLPPTARFESQLNAVAGVFEFTVKDVNHTMTFVSGKIIELVVDGVPLYGGYLFQATRTYPFPAMDTFTTPPEDTARYWKLTGVDFNVIFDKRFLRNTSNYVQQIPDLTGSPDDGAVIRYAWAHYFDAPNGSGFDLSSDVDNIGPPFLNTPTTSFTWDTQGTKARDVHDRVAQVTGALYYFDGTRHLHWHAVETAVNRWGLSDQPNKAAITSSPQDFQGATYGPREVTATDKLDHMVNDMMAWGGNPLGSSTGVIFSRDQDATSIADHYRWQYAEIHTGEPEMGSQAVLDSLTHVIVHGSPAAVTNGQERGRKYTQWDINLAWFGHDVPKIGGVPDHLRPGYLTVLELKTFGPSGSPLIQLLPLREVVVTIPSLDPDGNGYVRFDGHFGLSPDDPTTLWKFLLKKRKQIVPITPVTNDTGGGGAVNYGSPGSITPTPAPDGSTTVFAVGVAYVPGTTQVYLFATGTPGGVLLRRGIDYTESNPTLGQITISPALPSGDELLVNFTAAGAASTGTTPSGAVTVTADNQVIDGLLIEGTPGTGAGITATGTLASPIRNLTIRNCTINGFTLGIYLTFVDGLTIENCTIDGASYAGIACFSCSNGQIKTNKISNIDRTDLTIPAFLNNAYGIMLNRAETSSAVTDPPCTDFLIDSNVVGPVPLWMCINTHAGTNVTITNNSTHGSPRGIFIAGSPTPSGSGTVTHPQNVVIESNTVLGCTTVSGGSTNKVGIFVSGVQGGSVKNNTIGNSYTDASVDDTFTGEGNGPCVGVTISGNTVISG